MPCASMHACMRTLSQLLLLLAAAVAVTKAAPGPRLPADMSSWVYTPNPTIKGSDNKPARRFWDRSVFEQGNVIDNFQQLHPMLRKLNAGQPITVVVLGDSIAADFGGCFHRDEQHRQRHVVLAHRHGRNDECSMMSLMWMQSFMQQINATWPHPDHLLINLAKPASAMRTWALGECLEDYFPRQADLVVIEHLPAIEVVNSTAVEAERVLHRLWLHMLEPYPAVIFLNMHPALPFGLNWGMGSVPDNCIRDIRLCSTECPTYFQDKPDPQSLYTESELHTHAVASYYGLTSLSHAALVHALMRDRLPQRFLGISECEAFALMYVDAVHPNLYGRLLVADLLVNFLSLAEQHLAATAAAQTPASAPWKHALPRRPMEPDSVVLYRSSCLYSAAKPDADVGGSGAALGTMHMLKTEGWQYVEYDGEAKKYKPGWVATNVGATLWIDLPLALVGDGLAQGRRVILAPSGGEGEAGPQQSSSSDGWAGPGLQQGSSPGGDFLWHMERVARRLGASRVVAQQSRDHDPASAIRQAQRIRAWRGLEGVTAHQESEGPWVPPMTRARGLQQTHRRQTFDVRLNHLKSYKHMGKAKITCLEACTCSIELDGHHPSLRTSLPDNLFIEVTNSDPTGRCIMEVKVIPDTNSGEHKVKIMGMALGRFVNMTAQIQSKVLASHQRV